MQRNGTERSKTRICGYAAGVSMRDGMLRWSTAVNVTLSPYLSVQNVNPG